MLKMTTSLTQMVTQVNTLIELKALMVDICRNLSARDLNDQSCLTMWISEIFPIPTPSPCNHKLSIEKKRKVFDECAKGYMIAIMYYILRQMIDNLDNWEYTLDQLLTSNDKQRLHNFKKLANIEEICNFKIDASLKNYCQRLIGFLFGNEFDGIVDSFHVFFKILDDDIKMPLNKANSKHVGCLTRFIHAIKQYVCLTFVCGLFVPFVLYFVVPFVCLSFCILYFFFVV